MMFAILLLLVLLNLLAILVIVLFYQHLQNAEIVLEMARRSFKITDEQKHDMVEKVATVTANVTSDKVVEKIREEKASESGSFKKP